MKFVRGIPENIKNYEFKSNWFDQFFIQTQQRTPGSYQDMFEQDFWNIFNTPLDNSGGDIKIIDNDDNVTERFLFDSAMRFRPNKLQAKVIDLAKNIAQDFLLYGRSIYYLGGQNQTPSLHVVRYSPIMVFNLFGMTFQYLPKRKKQYEIGNSTILKRELRLLPSSKILYFAFPNSINRKIKSQNKTLKSLDRNASYDQVHNFFPQVTVENPNYHNHFSLQFWQETKNRALFKSTRLTGWGGRMNNFEKASIFFTCHRLLRFRRLQLEMRDHILTQLSEQLSLAGREYNPNYKITITASDSAPSIAHLDELNDKLSKEEVTFKEVIDYCFK